MARQWEEGDEEDLEIDEPLLIGASLEYYQLLPAFEPMRPGLHRVRVTASGRRRAYDETVTEAVEEYLVQIWPVSTRTARARAVRN
ncbi:MAG: hypothetical protein ACT4QF_10990 [Sporichthyaceae bacterium]